ncbi:MAG: hypothetical protein QOC71_378 [Thermoplasmata archaeon]|jgi:hypothetical protein|nr:hypothetical protein [Thermoplasmata archaeon]
MLETTDWEPLHPLWGVALRLQNADGFVRCSACGGIGSRADRPSANQAGDRIGSGVAATPCAFTAGCLGTVAPDALN